MPTTTANMGLQNPVGGDNARDVDKVYIPNNNNKLDVHRHTGGADGLQIGLTAIPSGATVPSPVVSGHTHLTGSAPTIAAGANIGTGGSPAVAIAGHDSGGDIGLTTGHAGVGTHLCTVTFNAAFVKPIVTLTQNSTQPSIVGVANVTTTSFEVRMIAATIDTTYAFYYRVVDES